MFAIQYALIICNTISCLPAIPVLVNGVDSDKFREGMKSFFTHMPNERDLPLLKLMMKFQFYALVAVYVLGIFAGVYCPTTLIGYMFATGNFLRVAYIGVQMLDAERWAMGGFSAKTIKTILIIQTVLGSIIIGCTYLSSRNDEYQAYAADMAASAEAKWETDGFYIRFLLCMHGFFTLVQIPGVIAPGMALKQYVTVESKLPTEKSSVIGLEFTMGFQQLAILMIQVFGAVMLWYAPSIDVIAIYWLLAAAYFTLLIFCYNLIYADEYGFDRKPMLVFMILNVFVAGASFQALNA